MNHGSLFSGIGGFDLAADWMGWNNIFHCEWNEFGQKVLKHYWPESISYADITKTDFTIHRGQIDILTGGFPCQPYSQAGKRKGKEDERHLWPEMLRAIREIQPGFVVGENVYGLVNWNGGLVFDEIQTDLENEGYEVQPIILPACGVNAPHQRYRVWFVAKNTNQNGWRSKFRKEKPDKRGLRNTSTGDNERIRTNNEEVKSLITDTKGGSIERELQQEQKEGKSGGQNSGDNATNSTSSGRIQNDKQQQSGKLKHACTSWEQFPTKSPICSRNDGISDRLDGITFPKWRSESIKAYGNAIVPQVAHEIFKAL